MKKLANSIGFTNVVVIGARGLAGGICMMWTNSLAIRVLEFDTRTVAVLVEDAVCSWNLIGFYGPPYQANRRKAWGNLNALIQATTGPWLCFGDFNCVVEEAEKEGGNRGSTSTPNFLKELLFELEAVDLGYSGNKFTWWNKRWGRGAIRERLDRAIASPSWRLSFPNASVFHLGAINSDHAPLLIDTNPADDFCPRPFRFEAMWVRDLRCGGVIRKAWSTVVTGSHAFVLCRKQSITSKALSKWNKEVFGNCNLKIKELTASITELQAKSRSERNVRKEAMLQGELNEWLRRNEVLWRQKSRETWLKDGDKNSKFFHLSTIIRRKRNSIDALKNDDGGWITNKKDIREHVVEKFSQLFTEENVNFPSNLENLISPLISDAENSELCRIPTNQEIKEVIFGLNSQKSPGPDGLPALFYKRYWTTVGSDVIDAVKGFFRSGRMLNEVNNSLIVLIPKIKSPSSVNHFRPISLCNTVYKTISKLIVSRIRPILDKLVSPSQSAFIPGRWIAENQLLVHELLHSFKRRKVVRGFVALKIDLQKAYDWVNWNFLQVVLTNFRFHKIIIQWIMECVSSVSASVLINGGKSKQFYPSRGLRQGDPLSPYLFILCQEVLSRIIDKEHAVGSLSGVKMNPGGPEITNVMFANDLMLFAKATS